MISPKAKTRDPQGDDDNLATRVMEGSEKTIFFAIGILLFLGAVALVLKSTMLLWAMVASPDALGAGGRFLDFVLLILMLVELAYTVTLSLRGEVLQAEPFLIVGLIAVIRRILVITVGEVNSGSASVQSPQSVIELAILTGVVLVFVICIFMLRMRPANGNHTWKHE
jgi:uncharacterized membrane protein (DUF373 family)